MSVAVPFTPSGRICAECGRDESDPIHDLTTQPTRSKGEGNDESDEQGKQGDPTEGTGKDSEPNGDPGEGTGDGNEDEDGDGDDTTDDDTDTDGSGRGGDEGDDPDGDGDDEGESGSGSGSGDGDEQGDDPGSLPSEMSRRGASDGGTPRVITAADLKALQRAVDEAATLEGDPEHGVGQVLRNLNGIQMADNSPYYYSATESAEDNRNAIGMATSAIRTAFMRSKTGSEDYEGGQRKGRLSGHDLWKVANRQEDRLFGQRTQPGIDRFDLWLLIDLSGSMAGAPVQQAAGVAQAFATACQSLGTIRMKVWGWTNAFAPERLQQARASFGAALVYQTGDDVTGTRNLARLPMGGTPDAEVLAWATEAIRKDVQGGERPIVVMVSDGMGYELKPIIDKARKHGVEVIGVNISDMGGYYRRRAASNPRYADMLREQNKRITDMYGKDYVVFVDDSGIPGLAGPLGRLIARIITPRFR